MILKRLTSPSFLVGLVISVGLTWLIAGMFLGVTFFYTLEGKRTFIAWSFLSGYPWLVIAGCIIAGALALLGDAYYRTIMLRHRIILTGLQSIIAPIIITLALFKLAPGTKEIEPDIPAIQANLFGDHGAFLKEADKIVLYSTHIDPYQAIEGVSNPELFHGHVVYGSTIIDDPETIQAIAMGLQNRVHWQSDVIIMTYCWWPRHGLRAHKGDEVRDYHVCFQCNEVNIYKDIESGDLYDQTDPEDVDRITLISSHKIEDPTPALLNGILDKAGIDRERTDRQ